MKHMNNLKKIARNTGAQTNRQYYTSLTKKRSEATETLRAGCKADPQTNKHTDRQGDYNTLRSLARSVIK